MTFGRWMLFSALALAFAAGPLPTVAKTLRLGLVAAITAASTTTCACNSRNRTPRKWRSFSKKWAAWMKGISSS
jgi:hypothetical protein